MSDDYNLDNTTLGSILKRLEVIELNAHKDYLSIKKLYNR